MPRWSVTVLVGLVVLGTGCAAGDGIDESIEDAFVACMASEGIAVDSVSVTTRDRGEHVETFEWDHDGDAEVESVGRRCEDAALEQFQVSRT